MPVITKSGLKLVFRFIWLLPAIVTGLYLLGFSMVYTIYYKKHSASAMQSAAPPQLEQFPKQYVASLDVARVFGRAPGCAEADPKLISEVADVAIKTELDPRILAATVAVESACDPFAISSKGAIGLTGVVPRIWKGSYNFAEDYNLLNPHDNLRVGATIEAGLIKQYGTINGLRRFNGLGVGCDTCDTSYPDKITTLAARR